MYKLKLLDCPHCGGEAKETARCGGGSKQKCCTEWVLLGDNVYSVRCANCKSEFDRVYGYEYKTVQPPNYCYNCGVAIVD